MNKEPTMVCTVCNDTHRMARHDGSDVPCTSCPTPCGRCRANRNGAYCTATPCACECHASARVAAKKAEIAHLIGAAHKALRSALHLSSCADGDVEGEAISDALHNAYPRTLPMSDHGSTDIGKLVDELAVWRYRFSAGESSPPRLGALEELARKVAALELRSDRVDDRLSKIEEHVDWRIER